MNSGILIEKKRNLVEQLKEIQAKLTESLSAREKRNFEIYLSQGRIVPLQEDGKNLRLLKKQAKHLLNYRKLLNREITHQKEVERREAIKKKEKSIKQIENRRGTLLKQFRPLAAKIRNLQAEDKKLLEEWNRTKLEKKTLERTVWVEKVSLTDLDEWLLEIHPELSGRTLLKRKFAEWIRHNQEVLDRLEEKRIDEYLYLAVEIHCDRRQKKIMRMEGISKNLERMSEEEIEEVKKNVQNW